MTTVGSDKKKAIVELTSTQDGTVIKIASRKKLYKVDVIRKLIDVLEGLEGDINIVAYDKNNVSYLNDFKEVVNLRKETDVINFNLNCKYIRDVGVQCDADFKTAMSFGGEFYDKKD